MKILALSDVHSDQRFIQKMAEKGAREKVDLVILAGDIFTLDGWTDGLVKPFVEKGLEVAVIPGNHEGMAHINFMVQKYGAKNLHGYSLIKNDGKGEVGIFGCGYADISHHTLTEQEFFDTLKQAHEQVKHCKRKVMLTHVQPSESILGLHNPKWGSTGVRKAVELFQPDLHICGHVHETHGIEDVIGKTRCVNVGKTGKIMEV